MISTDKITVNTQSSIRVEGSKIVYFDPFLIPAEAHDADYIFITHTHEDHFSPEDIAKVKKDSTKMVAPATMKNRIVQDAGMDPSQIFFMEQTDTMTLDDLAIETLPAYNIGKDFHKKEFGWVGYYVTLDGTKIYVSGDTDATPELRTVKADYVLFPIGGHFTMSVEEAADVAKDIEAGVFLPTHYGSMIGEKTDGQHFADLVAPKKVELLLKF